MPVQALNRACEIAETASQLVVRSNTLVARTLEFSVTATALGRKLVRAMAAIPHYTGHQPAVRYADTLSSAIAVTRAAAWQAAGAALEVRTMIGQPGQLPYRALGLAAPGMETLSDIQVQLRALVVELAQSTEGGSAQQHQLIVIRSGVVQLAEMGHRNIQIAIRVALALEHVQWQAAQFTHAIEGRAAVIDDSTRWDGAA